MWYEEEEEEGDLKGAIVFCVQAEHAGTRTYYFSAESQEEQEQWVAAMSEATWVQPQPTQRYMHAYIHPPTHSHTLMGRTVYMQRAH